MSKVTLTFDNGPDAQVTPHVLEVLARHDIKATFFVLGRKVAVPVGRKLAEEAARAGHWIGNHTFSHSVPLGRLSAAAALDEFERAEDALSWLEQPRRLFRPYGGAGEIGPHLLHPAVIHRLVSRQYSCVLWNVVPGDWRDPDGWLKRALEDCRSRDWSLVVLHDTTRHDTAKRAMAHLDEFLGRLAGDGFELLQDFPADCVPILDGRIVESVDQYAASA